MGVRQRWRAMDLRGREHHREHHQYARRLLHHRVVKLARRIHRRPARRLGLPGGSRVTSSPLHRGTRMLRPRRMNASCAAIANHRAPFRQIYAFFMTWRFSKRLEHYNQMQGPYGGGTSSTVVGLHRVLMKSVIRRRVLQGLSSGPATAEVPQRSSATSLVRSLNATIVCTASRLGGLCASRPNSRRCDRRERRGRVAARLSVRLPSPWTLLS